MEPVPLSDRRALRPAEVAPILGYKSRSSIYELVSLGLLRPIEGCRSMRFSMAEIERFANQTRSAA